MNPKPAAPALVQSPRPVWIRLPKKGEVCPWCGLSRSHLYALALEGKIKTRSLRQDGSARGVRLINLQSVLDFIETKGTADRAPDQTATPPAASDLDILRDELRALQSAFKEMMHTQTASV